MTLKTALLYNRYELKYHIPIEMVDDISKYIATHCEMDHFSKTSHDHYYTINNLYLDTPNFLFFQRSMAGVEGRFNMRVRTYGDEENPLYFLEVKKKDGGFVKKSRAKVFDRSWFEHLENNSLPESDKMVHQNDYAYDFAYNVLSYQARPIVFTQYRRKAYFSNTDDYARITFDKEMRYTPRENYSFERTKDMHYYDNQNYFDPYTNVVLELKCEARVPWWMIDLIKYFNLERSSFSKFLFAVNELNQDKLGVSEHASRISHF